MRKIKKYFVIILLSIFTLTTVETSSLNFSVYIVQAKASSSTKRKAQEAYRKFLTQRRYRYFTLWDIDKDGLKELLVTDGREQVGNSPTKAYAYTYTRGKLRYAGIICTYHIRSDVFIVSRSNTGNYKSLVDINATADFVHDF